MKVFTRPLPKVWDPSPKGCWAGHPDSRDLCQRPADGHREHQRAHPNGRELECWSSLGAAPAPVRRWALWSETFGYLAPLPLQTELLYETRRAAVAARLSGSHYAYRPVRVELRAVPKGHR